MKKTTVFQKVVAFIGMVGVLIKLSLSTSVSVTIYEQGILLTLTSVLGFLWLFGSIAFKLLTICGVYVKYIYVISVGSFMLLFVILISNNFPTVLSTSANSVNAMRSAISATLLACFVLSDIVIDYLQSKRVTKDMHA